MGNKRWHGDGLLYGERDETVMDFHRETLKKIISCNHGRVLNVSDKSNNKCHDPKVKLYDRFLRGNLPYCCTMQRYF